MTRDGTPLLAALRQALDADPHNSTLWAHYGDTLLAAGQQDAAIDAYRSALAGQPDNLTFVTKLVAELRRAGQLPEALIRAEAALGKASSPVLERELARVLLARGDDTGAREHYAAAVAQDGSLIDVEFERELQGDAPAASTAGTTAMPLRAGPQPEPADTTDFLAELGLEGLTTSFDDVVGLDDVKDQINLRIIAPFKRRDVFRAFGRKAGGGLLLYGPPGCGKTYIARATAGECQATFLAVSIHEMVDQYFGQSEKLVHELFERARFAAPSVLFFDEFDALGTSRGRSGAQFWRTLVNQMLQEMDGLAGRAEGVLVFAATNLPWNVDAAFRRPGRFDRALFVPPPDLAGREAILRRALVGVPGGEEIDVVPLAQRTELLTGADLLALVERASERALAASLRGDSVHPVTAADLDRTLAQTSSTASEWFANARNHARYANDGGQFDDLIAYLKSIKRW